MWHWYCLLRTIWGIILAIRHYDILGKKKKNLNTLKTRQG